MSDIVAQLRERAAERQRDGWELYDAMTPREMIDIAAEIERLRGVEDDAAEWVEERTRRLRADNERLRAALREIASIPTCPGAERERLVHVARAALERNDKEPR